LIGGKSSREERDFGDILKMAKKQKNIDLCIRCAKEFLNQGDAKSALEALEDFAVNDSQGVHLATPEFYRLLWVCQESLGIESAHGVDKGEPLTSGPQGGIDTKGLTWITALENAERLLREGKARESIAYFRFSINDNPGECGTASAMDRAQAGIKAAETLIKRMKSTDAALARKKI